jgi:PEGA domain
VHDIKTSCVVIAVAVLCSGAWCQTATTENETSSRKSLCIAETDKAKRDILSNTAQSDKKTRPVTGDWSVLVNAQPKLRSRFPESFGNSDIQQVECQAWADYRKQYPNGHLDLDSFAKYAAENYGGLKVHSKPAGAEIAVDNLPWDGPTNAQNMCRVGTRHVRLSKPGYYDAVGDADVKQGQWAIFERDLKEKP